ncbi:hypothetical protein Q5M85_06305 [Paraclostridium bifermentans]|nr:hypothetical protein [Paraclostridium bifermentans]
MTLSAVPAYIICVVLYTVIGFKYANNTIDYNQIKPSNGSFKS